MDKEAFVYWAFFLLNVGIAGAIAFRLRRSGGASPVAKRRAKAVFSWSCAGLGMISCLALLIAIVQLRLDLGHGVVLFFASMAHLIVTTMLVIAGRVVVGWRSNKSVNPP
jgi:hypothetical protein